MDKEDLIKRLEAACDILAEHMQYDDEEEESGESLAFSACQDAIAFIENCDE
jgi:hypothetical protein